MTQIRPMDIPDVKHVVPRRFGDARGWFTESFRADWNLFASPAVQDNHAYSSGGLTIRGLHYQTGASAQAKLLRCVVGEILDVAVDVRRGSPTYGQHVAATLTAEGGEQLFVPHGFAHGYATLTPEAHVLYKVDAPYDPEAEGAVLWSDPALEIDWPEGAPQLSDKDEAAPLLHDANPPFEYDTNAPYNCRCL